MKNKVAISVIIIVIVVVSGIGGYYLYTNSQQLDIQATNINIAQPNQSPQTTIVVQQGRVSSGASFNYVADLPGSYVMTFDNSFSLLSSKSVSLSFSTGGPNNQQSFQVSSGQIYTVTAALLHGQSLNGSFQVSGGSGNDINFCIQGNTCTESVSFSFTLVNSGSSNGYSTISLQSDGNQAWSNRHFVPQGQQVTENGTTTLSDCNSHTFNIVVTQQQKA